MKEAIKIILADDKDLWRKRLIEDLLPFNIRCIGEAENGKELLRQLKSKKPDVILLDLRMPVMDGNQTMQILRKDYPQVKVIILSVHAEAELVEDYIQRGAKGFIPKDALDIDMLAEAIRIVKNSGTYIYKTPLNRPRYTGRQREVIPLMCDGMTNKEIAVEIGISERAVEKQRQKIYAKISARRAVDFYKYAFSRGLDFLNRSVKRSKGQ